MTEQKPRFYLVGGAVRDRLLGLPVKDRDWVVVGATPEQMVALGFRPVGRDFPVFLHPKTQEEYALARTERKSGKGYKGFTFHTDPDVTLEQDLIRRDLTLNAMAEDAQGQIIDPYGGQQDLNNRILRHVSDAFAEDPLRVLRVARFAARFAPFGFRIADETLRLMQQLSSGDELAHLSAERVWQEFERALATPDALRFLDVLSQAGALDKLLPELSPVLQRDHSALHSAQLNAPELRFAALCWLALAEHRDAPQQVEALCARLRIPNRYRDLTLDLLECQQALRGFAHLDGEQRLALITRLRLGRSAERLTPLWALIAALFPGEARPEALLQEALQSLQQLAPKTLIAEGFKGAELGAELARRQRELLDRL